MGISPISILLQEFKVDRCTSLIPALGRQRLTDLCEFDVTIIYRVSSRRARATVFLKEKEEEEEEEEFKEMTRPAIHQALYLLSSKNSYKD